MDITEPKSVMKPVMGRPPKHRKSTHIRLDKGVRERIQKALRGKEKQADLIRAAVERELKRREKVSGRSGVDLPSVKRGGKRRPARHRTHIRHKSPQKITP